MIHSNISIEFSYLKQGKTNWKSFSLTPEEYFDVDLLDPSESLQVDSISRLWHALDYIPEEDRKEVSKITLKIIDFISSRKNDSYIYYWGNQHHFYEENFYSGPNPEDNWHSIKFIIVLQDSPPCYEVIRLEKHPGDAFFKVISHSLNQEDKNGIEFPSISLLEGTGKLMSIFENAN